MTLLVCVEPPEQDQITGRLSQDALELGRFEGIEEVLSAFPGAWCFVSGDPEDDLDDDFWWLGPPWSGNPALHLVAYDELIVRDTAPQSALGRRRRS